MEITLNNAHEEIASDGFGEPELVTALRITIANLTQDLEKSREVAREQAEAAEARRDELRVYWEDRLTATRERYQAEVQAKQERIDKILETEQGTAYIEVEDMKRQVERMTVQVERAIERMKEAEAEKDRAWASVNGSDNIDAHDPRVAHIWRKAARIATHAGFCTEYDRIAESLGIPEVEFDYSGYVSVRVSAYVSVPVSGTATRTEIADGDVDWSIDNSDILDELDSDTIEWEVDEVNIEADDN